MDNDVTALYMTEVGKCNGLPLSEEIALAKKIEAMVSLEKRGGPYSDADQGILTTGRDAFNHLVTANALLVVSVARPWHGRGVPYGDLIQEGNMGLMKAARKYEWRRGYKFSTYATWWVRQAVSRAVADQSRIIRVPVHMSDRLRKVGGIRNRLTQELGRRPELAELASEVGLTEAQTEEALRFAIETSNISLDEERGGDDEADFYAFLEDDSPPVDSGSEQGDLTEAINNILLTLDAREQRIIEMRMGLNGCAGRRYTLEEVGQKFGITRERVRQIEAEALKKLRHPRRARRVREFLE